MMLDEFLAFVEDLYGGSHSFEGSTLVIKNGDDKFKINLTDKIRFGKFTLYHRNSARRLDGTYCYHVQNKVYKLSKAIFIAYSHDVYKKGYIDRTEEDYQAFMRDWLMSCQLSWQSN